VSTCSRHRRQYGVGSQPSVTHRDKRPIKLDPVASSFSMRFYES
jgi:hypothetical protein